MSAPESRERLLAAAKSLVLTHGYAGTGVDAICRKAGLTKGSFYHFFASKDELGLATLEWSLIKGGEIVQNGPYQKLPPSRERALGFMKHMENSAAELWSGGCILSSFALELAETNDVMQATVSRMFDQVATTFASELAPLTDKPKELAEQYLAHLEGAIILAKAYRDPTRIRKSLRSFHSRFDSLAAAPAPV